MSPLIGSTFFCVQFKFEKEQANTSCPRSLIQINFKNKQAKRSFI